MVGYHTEPIGIKICKPGHIMKNIYLFFQKSVCYVSIIPAVFLRNFHN